jgi:hypothetical protein
MQLIQILLPLTANDRTCRERLNQVREDLTLRFGGLTLYRDAPAEDLWRDGDAVEEDAIVVVEVMTHELDRDWWSKYRSELERRFQQDEIVIRAIASTRL